MKDLTIVDRVKAYTRSVVQSIVDKEPLNYLEAAGLFGVILQARHNIFMLSSLYNQALDPELRELTKQAIYEQAVPMIEKCEELMRAGNAEPPDAHFKSPVLYAKAVYPENVKLEDGEIAIAVANITRTTQLTLFTTLQQCYQLEVAAGINELLSSDLQWSYRLLQLMLHRGWLPEVPKVAVENKH